MTLQSIPAKPLTTGDIANYCHVSSVAVLKWIKAGKLKAYRTPGGHHRISLEEFRAFLEKYRMPIHEEFFHPRAVNLRHRC